MRLVLLLSVVVGFCRVGLVHSATVNIDAGKAGQYQFETRPRLAEVLGRVAGADTDLYWPAARLYQDDALHYYGFERKRQQLIASLNLLAQQHEASEFVAPLLQLVKTARLATPVKVTLDPDAVLSRAQLNPLLDQGQYLLRVTTRPADLSILGFAGSHLVAHRYQHTVRDYTNDLKFSELADQTHVYVLGADLTVTQSARSLWSSSKSEVRPGSVLYVPLDESALPDSFQGFNQSFIEFLQHRVIHE